MKHEAQDGEAPRGAAAESPVASLLAMVGVVVLAYLPVLGIAYGFLDDYAAFVETRTEAGAAQLRAAMVTDGRPLYGVIVAAAFGWTSELADLMWIRAWSLAWTLATSLGIAGLLRRRGMDPWLAAATGAGWALLPSLQVLISWAQVGVGQTPAIFLAFCAAAQVEKVRDRTLAGLWGGVILHGAAVCIHQAAAMTFWSFLLLRWISAGDLLGASNRRLVGRGLGVGIAAMGIGFLAVQCAPLFGLPPSARGALLDDPLRKLEWFLLKPLPRAIQTFSLGLSGVQAGLCLVAYVGGGIVLWRRAGLRRRGWRIAAVLGALLVLAYAPNLVIRQNWPSYRSLVALSSSFFFLALPVLGAWFGKGNGRGRRLAGVVVIALAFKAGAQTLSLFALPQAIEFRVLRDQVRRAIEVEARPMVGRCASGDGGLADRVLGDEFGAVSAKAAWCLRFQMQTALHLEGEALDAWPLEVREADAAGLGVHVDGQVLRSWR